MVLYLQNPIEGKLRIKKEKKNESSWVGDKTRSDVL
jgi:hypothetical protein